MGFDPKLADTDGNGIKDGHQLAGDAGLPLRVVLVRETSGVGRTSDGVLISADGHTATFTALVNQDCVQRIGFFADPVFADVEICNKRAVRADVGVKPGEFRYFESKRLGPRSNIGHGLIAPGVAIDPYCCYVNTSNPTPPHPFTPPSMSINSVGGLFSNLVSFGYAAETLTTENYGFVVDYRVPLASPLVYGVMTGANGEMVILDSVTLPGLNSAHAMPMLYGHPVFPFTQPSTTINFGLRKFHYNLVQLRIALIAKGVDATNFAPGVGVHRWKAD